MIPTSNKGRFALLGIVILIPLCNFLPDFLSASSSEAVGSRSSASSSAWDKPESQRLDGASELLQNFSTYEANLPLFEAVKQNDLKQVRALLEGDANTLNIDNPENNDKNNQQGNKTAKDTTTKFDVNAEDPKGITPIIEATLLGATPIVELLLSHGATAQPAPGFRHTPLRAACLTANLHLIALLLDKGADPNAMSEGGRTPLMGACFLRPEFDGPDGRASSFPAVKLMLEDPRTDPTIRNSFGESALDLCRERGYAESVKYLEKRVEEWEKEHGVAGEDETKDGTGTMENVAEDKRRIQKHLRQ
mmetsp:Transcript_4376/g.8717  ORF Transcript_4376/g.8717 Transcript_4376/m.8717 type:complete len:306 (+) Transcript_4376:163-1080(+)